MYSLQSVSVRPCQRPSAKQRKNAFRAVCEILIAAFLSLAMLSGHSPANAQVFNPLRPLVVSSDRGGLLDTRLRQLHDLRESGRPVRITGRVCFSTCTMLLGLPQTCISPDTTFGFHGPTSYGRKLAPDRFEWASQVIAQYYPPALKRWYLETGRHRTNGIYRISGSQLIAMGVSQC